MAADRADFGSRLRAAREARGISVKDIAATTKISVLVLEALERNDPSRLPGGLFSRAFVRSYAKEVGLDPEQTVREFAERFGEGSEAVEPEDRANTMRGERAESGVRYGTAGWLGVAITVLLVIAWIGGYRYFSRRPQTGAPAPARAARTTQPDAPPAPPPPPLPTIDPPKAPSPPVPPPSPSETGTADAPPAPLPAASQVAAHPDSDPPATLNAVAKPALVNPALRVVVTATTACWVSAKVDDDRVAGRTLQAGETLELSAARAIVLTTGNAGGISYTINQSPGRAIGATGEVKTIVISTSNYRTYLTGGH